MQKTKLAPYAEDVLGFDEKYGLEWVHALNTTNLLFFSNALAGEIGELANIVKKIVRDGETPELWKKFDEEAVDVIIYLIELLNVGKCKLDEAWEAKHRELHKRMADRQNNFYLHMNRQLQRRE